MTDLSVVEKIAEWQRLKALVLDSVSSPITKRVYNMALGRVHRLVRLHQATVAPRALVQTQAEREFGWAPLGK